MAEVLVDKRFSTGTYSIQWTASDLPSGIYFVSISVEGQLVTSHKVILMK